MLEKLMGYGRFAAMISTSTVVMFGLMYLNTYAIEHVEFSQTRMWMALVMGATMAVIMIGFMWGMYKNTRLNVAIVAASVLVFHTWSEHEIAKFEQHWPIGTRQRLAFDLLLYTGQRSADVRVMTAGQVQSGYISLRQSKTDGALEIPIHPALAASLAARKDNHLVLVTTQSGKPRSEKGFSNWISDAAKAAGIPGCSAHGLRKSAPRRLAEAGCTVHEIMAITGHKSIKEVERYTRAVEQRASADAAMLKVQQTQREQKSV